MYIVVWIGILCGADWNYCAVFVRTDNFALLGIILNLFSLPYRGICERLFLRNLARDFQGNGPHKLARDISLANPSVICEELSREKSISNKREFRGIYQSENFRGIIY